MLLTLFTLNLKLLKYFMQSTFLGRRFFIRSIEKH